MSEEMLTITNKYKLVEEVTINTREQKKDKESGHSNQPSSSKGHDKKSRADRSMNNIERSCCNKEYRPRTGEFEGFLDQICIFHPQGKHKTQDYDRLQGFTDEVLKAAKKADQEKKPEESKGDFPEAHKEVNYIYSGLDTYESKRKQKLTA
jgi:exonuclease III